MSGYLFVHTCMHVTCSNKILGDEPVTTFPMNARVCCIGTSKKQEGARQYRQHAHVREKRYSLACEHKKRTEITGQRPCCGRSCTPSETSAFSSPAGLRLSADTDTRIFRAHVETRSLCHNIKNTFTPPKHTRMCVIVRHVCVCVCDCFRNEQPPSASVYGRG